MSCTVYSGRRGAALTGPACSEAHRARRPTVLGGPACAEAQRAQSGHRMSALACDAVVMTAERDTESRER